MITYLFKSYFLIYLFYSMFKSDLTPYVCVPHVCLVPKEVVRGIVSPGTGVMSYHVGSENRTWVLSKIRECS